jgi:hypothetical protein
MNDFGGADDKRRMVDPHSGRRPDAIRGHPDIQSLNVVSRNSDVVFMCGTSGLGLEAAKLFREKGATVIIVGQNSARLQSAASQLGDSVTALRGDVHIAVLMPQCDTKRG